MGINKVINYSIAKLFLTILIFVRLRAMFSCTTLHIDVRMRLVSIYDIPSFHYISNKLRT